MQPRVRSRFVRTVLESLQPGAGSTIFSTLQARLPGRLAALVETEVLSTRDPSASIALDDAEGLFFEVDSMFGEGSGRTLEEAGRSLAARTLTEGGVVSSSDPQVAARLLQAHLTQAFEQVMLLFDIRSTEGGFTLTLGVGGRPRSARALRHLAVGYLRAAATGAGPLGASLRIDSQIVDDRAHITVSYTGAPTLDLSTAAPTGPNSRRRHSLTARGPNSSGTLSAEVERILGTTSSPPPPRRGGSGSWPATTPAAPQETSSPLDDADATVGDDDRPTPADTSTRGSR